MPANVGPRPFPIADGPGPISPGIDSALGGSDFLTGFPYLPALETIGDLATPSPAQSQAQQANPYSFQFADAPIVFGAGSISGSIDQGADQEAEASGGSPPITYGTTPAAEGRLNDIALIAAVVGVAFLVVRELIR